VSATWCGLPANYLGGNAANGQTTLSAGVTVKATVQSTSAPLGVSAAQAEALISFNPTNHEYHALSQTKDFLVKVTIGSATVPGDYSFTIQGDPTPQPNGWGISSHTLSFTVSIPTETDTTPPTVVIADIGSPITFCSGGTPVAFTFTASDAESVITDVSVKVNGSPVPATISGLGTNNVSGSGSYTAAGIGLYTLMVSATSDGGSGDATEEFRVKYNVSWLPPISLGKTAKGGSTVPVKFTVRDCNNAFVHDESIQVNVWEVTSTGNVTKLSGVFGDGADAVRIDDISAQYIINFQTEPGIHI
jgi:hypothetical protein